LNSGGGLKLRYTEVLIVLTASKRAPLFVVQQKF
jgi:hypothetical protein